METITNLEPSKWVNLPVLWIFICLTSEVWFWSFKLFRYGFYVDAIKETYNCHGGLYHRSLKIASIMSSLLAGCLLFHWTSIMSKCIVWDWYTTRCFIIMTSGYLGLIHHLALLARCTQFPVEYYPPASMVIKRWMDRLRGESNLEVPFRANRD